MSGRGDLIRDLFERGKLVTSTTVDEVNVPQTSSHPELSGGIGRANLLANLNLPNRRQHEPSFNDSMGNLSNGRGMILQHLTAQWQKTVISEKLPINVTSETSSIKFVKPLQESMDKLSIYSGAGDNEIIKTYKGTAGISRQVLCNYVRLKISPNRAVYQYNVEFFPLIDSIKVKSNLLATHNAVLGSAKIFDGNLLFLPRLLPNNVTKLQTINPHDNHTIEINIVFLRERSFCENINIFNILFHRIMKTLNYISIRNKIFDPTKPKIIPQHRLEIWPGYATSIKDYEGGVMLCLDVSHKLLSTSHVLDHMKDIYLHNKDQFQLNASKSLLGQIVVTRYNNKTYRIDDIDFKKSPMDTFDQNNGKQITFCDYYKSHYGITITDLKQPLLLSRKNLRVSGKSEPVELIFCLIPELSFLTGLSNEVSSNMSIMRDIATYTRVTPNQRMNSYQKYIDNINKSKEAQNILGEWGLSLDDELITVNSRQLLGEKIEFANKTVAIENDTFFQGINTAELLEVVNLKNWALIYTKQDANNAKKFIDIYERNARPMGICVSRPINKTLDNDRTETYVNALRDIINSYQNIQIIVLIVPTVRGDRYSAIKKICCSEYSIPSQVINSLTLRNDNKIRNIVQKIAFQMNCKMGGTLWSIKIPLKNTMICGIDTYHSKTSNSVSAFVASINSTFTKWYSHATIQNKNEELLHGLCASFRNAIQAYRKMNNLLPERVIIFRDGVSNSQFKMCTEYEMPQIVKAAKEESIDYKPLITFVIVQKNINTKILSISSTENYGNAPSGTIVDNTITDKYLYDYYLIPQNTRLGTVTPSHYVVLHDDSNFKPDIIQRLSYKLCFLYYNWTGSVRVPACCQYAHKMAYLVGESIQRSTSEQLADKLFYL